MFPYNMLHKGILFLILLFFILVILISIRELTKKYLKNDKKYSKKFIEKLSYSYILFYSIIAGILIYFGIEDFKNLLSFYIKDVSLCSLISVTIVIGFCFIYSALFKDILEVIFNKRIEIREWENVGAYIAGRIVVIFFIFVVYNKIIKYLKKK